jgi:hypothetical protein
MQTQSRIHAHSWTERSRFYRGDRGYDSRTEWQYGASVGLRVVSIALLMKANKTAARMPMVVNPR